MLGILLMGMAASLAGAMCAFLCLKTLREERAAERFETEERDTGEGDEALREGILNLLRYAPGGKEKEEG